MVSYMDVLALSHSMQNKTASLSEATSHINAVFHSEATSHSKASSNSKTNYKSVVVSKRADASYSEVISMMLSGEAGLHGQVFSNRKPASPGEAISNCEATPQIENISSSEVASNDGPALNNEAESNDKAA